MPDKKIRAKRKIDKKYGVRLFSDTGWQSRCSACRCKFFEGEAILIMCGKTSHRQCMKDFIEGTYELVPATEEEREDAGDGLLEAVDMEKTQHAFERYREMLLERLA